ncbi:hypothetical protein [Dactylosporangium cerinum]
MRRRSLEVLGLARDEHGQLIATTGHPLLSDEDRRELRPVLRAYAVQRAALARSRWLWGYHALRLATAVCAVAVPVVALVIWVGGSETLWAALTSYLLFGAIALLGHGIQQNGAVKPYVTATVIAAVVAAVVTAVLAVFTGLWSGIASGIAAAGALLVLAEIRLFGLIAVRTAVVVPLAMRRAGWLLPPQLAAVHLLQLLDGLHRARSTCRHPRRRRNFLRWMGEWIDFVQWDLPEPRPACASAQPSPLMPVPAPRTSPAGCGSSTSASHTIINSRSTTVSALRPPPWRWHWRAATGPG